MTTYPAPVENLPVLSSLVLTETASQNSSTPSTTPTGAITAYFGSSPPAGWLMCDGSEYSTTELVSLYNLLNSSCTPDLRGALLGGSGTSGSYNSSTGQRTSGQPVGKSYSEDSKKVTQNLINSPIKIEQHSRFMSETDRTIVALLWHEKKKKGRFLYYSFVNSCYTTDTTTNLYRNTSDKKFC